MGLRKALLKAASILALTAGSQGSADAAISPEYSPTTARSPVSSPDYSDSIFDLLAHTNGSLSADAVETAMRAMFRDPSTARIESFPRLLTNLAGLGAGTEVLARSKSVLAEIVSSSQAVEEDLRESVLQAIEVGPSTYKLAQAKKKRRDPDEVGQVPGAQS